MTRPGPEDRQPAAPGGGGDDDGAVPASPSSGAGAAPGLGRRVLHWFRGVHTGLAVALLAVTLAARVDHWHWFLALFAHFPVQLLALATLLALTWPWMRPRRLWVAPLLLATLVLNALTVAPQARALLAPGPLPAGGPALRVLAFNTWPYNGNTTRIWDEVGARRPDIAVLFEASGRLHDSIDTLSEHYATDVVGQFLVLVARGVEARVDRAARLHHCVSLDVVHDGRPLQLVVAHPFPAIAHEVHNADLTFADLEAACAEADTPLVIVGDLNTTPWGWRFRRLLERGGLLDAGLDPGIRSGWQPTFPAWPPLLGLPFGIPIDHCLHTPELLCTRRELGPGLGSNHRSLSVDLAWPR